MIRLSYNLYSNIFLIIILLLINQSKCDNNITTEEITTTTQPILYDLSTDPTEQMNLAKIDIYSEEINRFNDRIEYWKNFAVMPQVPNPSIRYKGWASKKGISPWVETDFKSIDIKQRYNNENAPNIVFVLVDDWGWNDVGFRSNYLAWTTPTIDSLMSEGINLDNYYTYQQCTPSRGALMTGRFALRLGLWEAHDQAELPLHEVTLAQELKSAGYQTYLIGKWHLGTSTNQHLPNNRGFDYFYGYLSGYIDYWSKTYDNFQDLYENKKLVSDPDELSSDLHTGHLFQTKVQKVIEDHSANYPNKPMFLYYAMQLIHAPWTAPKEYLSRCQYPIDLDESIRDNYYNYCAMNVMMDEAIANLTCTLHNNDMSDNTVLIIASDNGGEGSILGNSYPFKGHKGSYYRGGISATALIHSRLIPVSARGSTYSGLTHVTDWLPTLMGLATDGDWMSGYTDVVIDGVDMWDSIISNSDLLKKEIVHYLDRDSGSAILQIDNYKYFNVQNLNHVDAPLYVFVEDDAPEKSRLQCENPSLVTMTLTALYPTITYKLLMNKVEYFMTFLIFLFSIFICLSIVTIMKNKYNNVMDSNKNVEIGSNDEKKSLFNKNEIDM